MIIPCKLAISGQYISSATARSTSSTPWPRNRPSSWPCKNNHKPPDTFIFMDEDLCHHSGEITPSRHLYIPSVVLPPPTTRFGLPCPGAVFEELQSKRNRSPDEPFSNPAMGLDIPLAIDTIVTTPDTDANDSIWFIYAHDPSSVGAVDLFSLSADE